MSNYESVRQGLLAAILGIGGDSHGRLLFEQLKSALNARESRLSLSESFAYCKGGTKTTSYMQLREYRNLGCSNATICVLMIGSNDMDVSNPLTAEEYVDNLIRLFMDLSRLGKVVYVVGLPMRETVHNIASVEFYKKISRKVSDKLAIQLHNRFIKLPSHLYAHDSYVAQTFHGQERCEKVHLKPQGYMDTAIRVLDHITADLKYNLSSPSTIPCLC